MHKLLENNMLKEKFQEMNLNIFLHSIKGEFSTRYLTTGTKSSSELDFLLLRDRDV